MEYSILLLIILLFPLALGLIFRVSASVLFFSIMSGELLARFFHVEAERSLKVMTSESLSHYGEALILIIPIVLTAIVMRGTLPKSKLAISFIPLLISGIVFAVFLLPILPPDLQTQLHANEYAMHIYDMNSAFVGIIIITHLVLMWIFDRGEHGGKKHHRKKG